MKHAITRRTLFGAAAGGCLCSAAAQEGSCCRTVAVPEGGYTAVLKRISIDLRQVPSLAAVGGSAMLAEQGIIIAPLTNRAMSRLPSSARTAESP